jgi:hypothetical protein
LLAKSTALYAATPPLTPNRTLALISPDAVNFEFFGEPRFVFFLGIVGSVILSACQ